MQKYLIKFIQLGLLVITFWAINGWASDLQEASGASLAAGSFFHLIWSAGYVVKLVLLVLIMSSILSWAIIILKFMEVQKAFKHSRAFSIEFWDSHSLNELNQKAKNMEDSPLLSIFKMGYTELLKISQIQNKQEPTDAFSKEISGVSNINRAMSKASLIAKTDLEKHVTTLATIGSSAPFIGLFGTVWGIVNAFQGIGVTGSATLATVAPGIAEALVATAIGLVAAIPAVVFYNYFVNRIKLILADMENFSSDFLNIIERHFFFEKK